MLLIATVYVFYCSFNVFCDLFILHLSPPLSTTVVPGRFMPAGMGFGGMGFGGMGGGGEGGNRLGGKEAAVDSGVQQQAIQMREAGKRKSNIIIIIFDV